MSLDAANSKKISLVLFDIDGTLMITKGASSRCMKRAGQIVLGPTFQWHPVTVGTLDPQIFDQLATANGIAPTAEQRQRYEQVYLDELEKELTERQEDITVLPGIASLVELLHARSTDTGDVVLGVLTGNFRRATELKLQRSGLGIERFPVIACAEHGESRNDLPRIAIQMANQQFGPRFDAANTILVGDTPRDIDCALANNCKCVSVATGHYSAQQLIDAGGSPVVETLENPAQLLSLIVAPP